MCQICVFRASSDVKMADGIAVRWSMSFVGNADFFCCSLYISLQFLLHTELQSAAKMNIYSKRKRY